MTIQSETKFVEGDPCRKCGTTQKYEIGNVCVFCTKMRNKRLTRKQGTIRIPKRKHYPGEPCPKCKCTLYYKNGSCVECYSISKQNNPGKRKKRTIDEDYDDIKSEFIGKMWQAI